MARGVPRPADAAWRRLWQTGDFHEYLIAGAANILSRCPASLEYLVGEQDPRGFALRHAGRVVGHLPWHHQELVVALNHLDALARSPRALAAVLEAAGASALARVGALLARRTP